MERFQIPPESLELECPDPRLDAERVIRWARALAATADFAGQERLPVYAGHGWSLDVLRSGAIHAVHRLRSMGHFFRVETPASLAARVAAPVLAELAARIGDGSVARNLPGRE